MPVLQTEPWLTMPQYWLLHSEGFQCITFKFAMRELIAQERQWGGALHLSSVITKLIIGAEFYFFNLCSPKSQKTK